MFQALYPMQINNAEIILTFQNNSELREIFGKLYKSSDTSSLGTQLLTCVPACKLKRANEVIQPILRYVTVRCRIV